MIRSIFLPLAFLLVLAGCAHPAPPPADRAAYIDPTSGQHPFYPTALLVQREEGRATVNCMVATDGTARDCHVAEAAGNAAFATAALDYASHAHFLPAIHGGVPVEGRTRSTVTFALERDAGPATFGDRLLPRKVAGYVAIFPARMLQAGREGSADVSCRIAVDGFTKGCAVTASFGGQAFDAAALDYASHLRYAPALEYGTPVETSIEISTDFRFNDSILPKGIPDVLPDASNHGIVTSVSDQPVSGPPLAFPAAMLASGRRGIVSVRCGVTVQGTPHDCRIVGSFGDRDFDAAALDMLSHARFKPATANGQPVEASHEWTLNYGIR